MNIPVEKGIVSTKTAEKVVKMHETEPESVPDDVVEFEMIEFKVPENYAGERFLTRDDVQKDKDRKKN